MSKSFNDRSYQPKVDNYHKKKVKHKKMEPYKRTKNVG